MANTDTTAPLRRNTTTNLPDLSAAELARRAKQIEDMNERAELRRAEMERLKKVYGEDKNEKGEFTGVPVAVAVYGQHAIGIRALKEAMQSTVLPNKTPVTPYDVSPPMRQDLLQALTDTPSEISDLIGADDDEIEEAKIEEVEAA